ncbi:MAG: RNA polymerase subunit sigma [Thermoplasmata archaeon]|nr:MAG: RNA polymerase subunit sigma [Thermoplasmata archaeon]
MEDDSSVLQERIGEAAEIIRRRGPALVLTGAGISIDSGIPPFRGPGGLWERYDPEEYGHIEVLKRDPEKAWIMLREMLTTILKARPNEAHYALAELERAGFISYVVTQNVDGLHEMAGSRRVLNFHGGGRYLYCMKCSSRRELESVEDIDPIKCTCGGYFRPPYVFFGEPIPHEVLSRSFIEATRADVILVIGTSAGVYPAAQLPYEVKRHGGVVVEVNPSPTPLTGTITDIFIQSGSSDALVKLKEYLLG